jgi:hypothetical protein
MTIPSVCSGAIEAVDTLAAVVQHLDVAVLAGDDAAELTRVFARAERLAATAKAMTARRASDCQHWARSGARSPDQWLAQVSGTTAGAARTSLAIAKQMDAQPEFAGACQAGALSPAQAGEIAAAAEADPDSTRRLVDQASRSGLRGLRESCRQVVTAGRSAQDDEARRAAMHRGRNLRTWIDGDGAGPRRSHDA